MPTFTISLQSGSSGSGDWLPYVLFVWLVVWLWNLSVVLIRSDFDGITRLTWTVVLIFVPFFGVLLYWSIAPTARARTVISGADTDGTPWQGKAGHTLRDP